MSNCLLSSSIAPPETAKLEHNKPILKTMDKLSLEAKNNKKNLKSCVLNAEPINWIMRYCAYLLETGDEIAIQESKCFLNAEKDISPQAIECEVKKKYKKKYCEALVASQYKYTHVDECMLDLTIEAFFAGG